jgi:hypothetical protein
MTVSTKTFNIMPLSLTTYLILSSVSVVRLNVVAPMNNQIGEESSRRLVC